MIFLKLFYAFFKIGLFGFGGGYAMISMIQDEVVSKHHWLTSSEFTDIVAISQVTPGAIGINTATYVGFSSISEAGYSSVFCLLGSLLATFAVVLPSFILMIIISRFFLQYSKKQAVADIFSVLRPAVIGLIAAASLTLMNTENFGSLQNAPQQFYISSGIFVAVFISAWKYRISPILLTFLAGIIGLIVY
ncbi:MAG: chromate transporter [Bacteroidales bacterium]|jgi:chromate transporter|nr:chromate transporter [Bacteroidales bacterium]MBP5134351.1 chromate transporter [Paludibacteraceae bacterium]MBR6310303.1 chromate transporter [Paludibacteraceae bacterium]MDD6357777.1 chromate transporter [Bacteroidales bacterium]